MRTPTPQPKTAASAVESALAARFPDTRITCLSYQTARVRVGVSWEAATPDGVDIHYTCVEGEHMDSLLDAAEQAITASLQEP